MLRPKRRRLDPLENFSFQAIRHDILDEAERGNYATILLLKTKWELMWRMCGKPPSRLRTVTRRALCSTTGATLRKHRSRRHLGCSI